MRLASVFEKVYPLVYAYFSRVFRKKLSKMLDRIEKNVIINLSITQMLRKMV